MTFAKEFVLREKIWWNDVIFVNESKFEIPGCNDENQCGEKLKHNSKKVSSSDSKTCGGGGLMVWGCISTVGIGKLIFTDDILDKNKYLNILKENLKYKVQ